MNPSAPTDRGMLLADLSRPTLRIAARAWPNGQSPAARGAIEALAAGRYEEAASRFHVALCAEPHTAALWHHLGAAFVGQQKRDEGAHCWLEASRLSGPAADADSPGTRTAGRGEPRGGCRVLPRGHPALSLRRRPLLSRIRAALLNRFADAAVSYQECLRLDPRFVNAHHDMGLIMNGLGRPGEGFGSYLYALRLDATHFSAWNNLGLMLQHQRLDTPKRGSASRPRWS